MRAIAIFVFAIAVTGCSGATALYETPQSTRTGNSPVSGQASFSITGTTLNVLLTNFLVDESKAHEAISGLAFDLIGAETQGALVARVSGKQGKVNNKRTVTEIVEFSGSTDLWTLTAPTRGSRYSISSWPKYAILADPGPTNTYAGKGSVGGKGHEPFLIGPTIISLEFATLSPHARISDVELAFGNGRSITAEYERGDLIPSSAVPEATTLLNAGIGLVALACSVSWRRKTR